MISKRIETLVHNGSAIRAMFEEGKRLAGIYGAENVFDFSIGNPYFPPPEAVKNAIVDIITHDDPMHIHGYTANAGYPEVRTAVAENLNKRFGTNLSANNITMCVGAAAGLNVVFRTLLNPDEEVIVLAPYFFEYRSHVENSGGKLVIVPTKAEEGFMPDVDAICAAINEKTKAVIINNPNNPTGVIYPAEMLKKLGDALEKKQAELGTTIYVISDEPYRELAYDGVEVPYLPKYCRNAIICYSWSKSLSLPGERIGYIVVPSEIDDSQLVYDGTVVSNRILGFVNAPSLMQLAVARCINESTDISAYDANRKLLYNGLHDLGFECAYPAGAFYLWVKSPIDDQAFIAAGKKYNILMVPGTSFAFPGYVRLAYCVSPDMIKRSLPAFAKLAKDCGM
jgi:aspartate aminotransferase